MALLLKGLACRHYIPTEVLDLHLERRHTVTCWACAWSCGTAEQVAACFGAGVINTAWIERLNGTFRARLCACVRRGRHLARQTTTLHAATYLTGAVSIFCTPHRTLSLQAHRSTTLPMTAGLTDHCWSVEEALRTLITPPRW